ncbi:MAG: helix-turn-helix domain-containing protein [Treponema sp.]|nr:helix-turn-helix transcriptional regulator [Treponema sp.]MCR5621003.1 helix-turn-helix domain-containing protein [Treponema sp.]
MDFRERLREEISFVGLSNKELAAKAGITLRSLVSYVSGQSCMPSADVAVKLARALGTTVEYLVTGQNASLSDEASGEKVRRLLQVYTSLPEKQKSLLLAVAEDIQKNL